ncbi:MAG: hypothetical protein ACOC5T_05155 [Elusimicrobiota bacterium]
MSKWINKKLFDKYVEEKGNEVDEKQQVFDRSSNVWRTPDKGTIDRPKIYEGRFIQDPKGEFTIKYFYHLFQVGDRWYFALCSKTWDFQNWCPFCAATMKLYQGTNADKTAAYNYKRKIRHVGNFYIVDDPRDNEEDDEERKVSGTVRLYEFPDAVERKLKQEILEKDGLGPSIFDPGEDGYNFIIKVRSTKPNKHGKSFPDYSDSTFARRPGSLGSDSKIKSIMEQTVDLREYLSSLKVSHEDMINILKQEMLWEMVKDEWKDNIGGLEEDNSNRSSFIGGEDKEDKEDDIPDFSSSNKSKEDEDENDEYDGDENEEDNIDESQLLEELDKL